MRTQNLEQMDDHDLEPDALDYSEDDSDDLDYDDYDEADPTPSRGLGWLLIIAGGFGLLAAFMLTVERIKLLQDPTYVPSCSFNPIVSCSSVMESNQAELFGFSNSILGLIGFPLVIVTGVLVLGRIALPAWYWRWLQVGVTYGLLMVVWLISQSVYVIGALCPYCMVVWTAVIPLFWYITSWNIRSGQFGAAVADSAVARFLSRWTWTLVVLSFAVVLTLILIRFWSYWSTLI